jgi:shikimate kinase
MNIILIGYRGSGKTSVGRELAKLLERPFFDSDRMVFAKTGRTVGEIVEAGGWPAFREAEKAVIAELSALDQAVISLGGGAVMDPDNVAALEERGKFVWLKADARTLARRMQGEKNGSGQRPSLTGAGTLEEVERVLAERLPVYRALADLAVDTTGKYPAGIAAEIAAAVSDDPAPRRVKTDRRRPHVR